VLEEKYLFKSLKQFALDLLEDNIILNMCRSLLLIDSVDFAILPIAFVDQTSRARENGSELESGVLVISTS
jgi:hypothetical protein